MTSQPALAQDRPAAPQPYVPTEGGPAMRKTLPAPGQTLIDLSLNENSYGASPQAEAAAARATERLNRYPDPGATDLRRTLASFYGLDAERIVCGNGSEELLDVLARCYLRPGDEVIHSAHGFLLFKALAARVGATPIAAPERAFTADVDAILSRVGERTKLVFLANPNNPTGTMITAGEVARLVDGLPPHVMLVLDAAYAEFAEGLPDYEAGLHYADERDNVVVLRTFSKGYGLAAVRVGWAYAPDLAARAMNRVRGVGNVNAVGQAAAIAAMEDQPFLNAMLGKVAAERARVERELTALGLAPLPSATNFTAIGVPEATGADPADLQASLADQEAIIIRHLDDHGMPRHLRATVGLPEENDRLIAALAARLS